jgi:N-acylneuraminate cytidylyltransferase
MSNLAIIPIRMGSKRLPYKNVRDFFGKPIFVYTIEHAKNSYLFDEIMVSTESDLVDEMCSEYGQYIPFMRPEELAADNIKLVDVCAHVLEEYEERGRRFDNFCMLWATAPMRSAEDIVNSYGMLDVETDAVVAVTDYDLPVFCAMHIDDKNRMKPIFPKYIRLSSPEQPRAVCDNGSMCWVKVKAFKEHKTWLPPELKGYWMPRHHSVDIETIEDWNLTEYLYQHHFLNKKIR